MMRGRGIIATVLLPLTLILGTLHFTEAIYPDDHWSLSTKLTTSNFNDVVQAEIDAGRTMFAPAWNQVTKAFAGNKDVSFGDVNLSEERISGPPHNPGMGGWPTIRYFNKETGIEGGSYEQQTSKAICDELGNEDAMTSYVLDYGNTSLCSITDGAGCIDREVDYIQKVEAMSPEDRLKQLTRLESYESESMKPDLLDWVKKRKMILKQFVAQSSSSSGEL